MTTQVIFLAVGPNELSKWAKKVTKFCFSELTDSVRELTDVDSQFNSAGNQ